MDDNPDEILKRLGYPLDELTPEGSLIEAVVIDGLTIYASGQVPFANRELISRGKVSSEVDLEQAQRAAALCAANVLRAVRHRIGSLIHIDRVLRMTGYVNADPDFTDAHLVINGASQLVREVFGEHRGRHARTALGLMQLPLGASTEVEMILKLKE